MNPNSPIGQNTTTGIGTTGATGSSVTSAAQDTYSETQGTGGLSGTATRRTSGALRAELSNLKGDLDTLLGRATTLSDDELSQEHARLMAKFSSVRSAARGVAAEANRQFTRSVDATSEYVKDKPLQSLAVASGIGLMLGLLVGRR